MNSVPFALIFVLKKRAHPCFVISVTIAIFASTNIEKKVVLTDIFFDAATGISYNDLLNFEKTDNIRRAIVQGLFNVFKNILQNFVNDRYKWNNKFGMCLSEQLAFNSVENFTEDLFIEFLQYIEILGNEKYI